MADVVDKATRSRMMAGIRGKNTKPELVIRSALHRRGLRFKLHDAALPGKPDLVFPKFGAVVFIHGCFWHRHECQYFKWPRSNKAFWRSKLLGNVRRDAVMLSALENAGWRVCVLWECGLKQKNIAVLDRIHEQIAKWIRASDTPRKSKSWSKLEIPSSLNH